MIEDHLPESTPQPSPFAEEVAKLEVALNAGEQTASVSDEILKLFNEYPNRVGPAPPGQELCYREVVLESGAMELNRLLTGPAREAFIKDIFQQFSTPVEGQAAEDNRKLLLEALQAKFPELVDPNQPDPDRPDPGDTTTQELAATRPPVDGSETELEINQPEAEDEEAQFWRELAECQDVTTLRGLIEDRSERIKAEIEQKSDEARERLRTLDNNALQTLLGVEAIIMAGNLPRAIETIRQSGNSDEEKRLLMSAVKKNLLFSAASWLRGSHYYLDEAANAAEDMPLSDSEKDEMRAYLDGDLFGIINSAASRASEGDEIQSDVQTSRALAALANISDPRLASKIKEIFALKEPSATTDMKVEELISEISTPSAKEDKTPQQWNEYYKNKPVETMSDQEFDLYLMIVLNDTSIKLQQRRNNFYGQASGDSRARQIFSKLTNRFMTDKHGENRDRKLKTAIRTIEHRMPAELRDFARAAFDSVVLDQARAEFTHPAEGQTRIAKCRNAARLVEKWASNEEAAHMMRQALDGDILVSSQSSFSLGEISLGEKRDIVKYASSGVIENRIRRVVGLPIEAPTSHVTDHSQGP